MESEYSLLDQKFYQWSQTVAGSSCFFAIIVQCQSKILLLEFGHEEGLNANKKIEQIY